MNRFEELKTLVLSLEDEFHKFYEKDNKAAGTRVRKGMQTLKKIAQEIRTNVSISKASIASPKDSDGKQA
ncbi:MAG: histone H1 [Candidatus Cardinium sp.]|uniref:histone H1 n=1 Tax=Cardinium endosymbiont of Dermatophagoides farinae TaxID=2597823 RepID=UPI001182CAA1|nr:histone H1 [Cardinium endosymbiont of Dermatophagoides farinae]TSJ80517.1 histone H1 [Cardinium endosymbiont of Dermatophagoides farinae]UWW96482.1 MAG: histone H1 [Candidatus Cardinium sp.]